MLAMRFCLVDKAIVCDILQTAVTYLFIKSINQNVILISFNKQNKKKKSRILLFKMCFDVVFFVSENA